MLALQPPEQFTKDSVLIVNGTLPPRAFWLLTLARWEAGSRHWPLAGSWRPSRRSPEPGMSTSTRARVTFDPYLRKALPAALTATLFPARVLQGAVLAAPASVSGSSACETTLPGSAITGKGLVRSP